MGQTLRDRLTRIYGAGHAEGAEKSQLRSSLEKMAGPRSPGSLADFLGGVWKRRPAGRLLSVDRTFPLDYRHGRLALSEIFAVRSELVRLLAGSPDFGDFDPRRALFLDTETTGLAGGAGTCVFLVGLGFFDGDQFRIRQLFLPGYQFEQAFLEELSELLGDRRFQFLVTFNGKSYDLNLLENRFVMQRLQRPFAGFDHLDLLHPSRLLWKDRLQDCALQNLERRLLQLHRQGDVPSAMIPSIYFNYLHRGQFRAFDRVFEHNRIDLLTMVGLTTLAARLIEEPDERLFVNPSAAARLHQLRGNWEKAEQILESALSNGSAQSCALTLQLATIKKKRGSYEEALPLFLRVVRKADNPPLPAFEEAAKILEHQMGDFKAALELVHQAMRIESNQDLRHRSHRLQCRLQGKRWY